MNREILFRGKRKDNDEWVYGSLINKYGRCFIVDDNNHHSLQSCVTHKADSYCWTSVEVIPETVGQYTGLNDKNGKKIFENDVIKYENEKTSYTVMFDPTGYWCLDGNGIRNSEILIQLDDINEYIEVIGNIFDLKGENYDS